MSHPVRGTVRDKLLVELIEADVEIGFGLIDDAKAYSASGQTGLTSRALQNAITVLTDIESRLGGMREVASAPFRPLVAELRKQIAEVNRQNPEDQS